MTAEHDLQGVIERIAQTEPTVLWEQREAIEDAIRRIEWPRLEFVPETEDSEAGFKCPHCGTFLDGYHERLTAVDVAERWTSFDELRSTDVEKKEAGIVYDDPGEFAGLAYQCLACSKPVALPEGWTEGVRW